MRSLAVALTFILLSGCATRHPGGGDGSSPETKDPSADLYRRKCISCHLLPLPGDYSAEEWTGILDKHRKKAGLSEAEREAIYRYLISTNDKGD